jgi:hypothetical protein
MGKYRRRPVEATKKKTKLTVNSTSSLADSYQALVLDAGTSQKPEPS